MNFMQNKWAVVGLGFIYPRHKAAIEAVGDTIVATCDRSSVKDPDFISLQGLINSPTWQDVTHVAICTPNYVHREMCEAAQEKVVLCEKPLTLSSQEAEALPENVFGVLQLRHHPEVIRLQQELDAGPHTVDMIVKVKRDEGYWMGWKGDEQKSGGILFNLGIHYFDLLLQLFGQEYQVLGSAYSRKLAEGHIQFGSTKVTYHIAIADTDKDQDRRIEIDGQAVSLSKQDNLSFEGLHTKVYQELKEGRGVNGKEAAKSIRLVEKLKHGF